MYHFAEADVLSLTTLLNSYEFAANNRVGGPESWPGSVSPDPRLQILNELGLLVSHDPGIRGHRTYRLQCPPLHPAVANGSEELKRLREATGTSLRRVFVMPPDLFARYTQQLALLQGPEYTAERVVSDLAHIGGSEPYDFKKWPQPAAQEPAASAEEERLREKVAAVTEAMALIGRELPQIFALVENYDLRKDPCLLQAQQALESLYLLSRRFAHKDL